MVDAVPPLYGLTPREARKIYLPCLDYVMQHTETVQDVECHPLGRELLGIYGAIMNLSNLMRRSPAFGSMPYSALTREQFSQQDRETLAEAPLRIENALRMRDPAVQDFAEMLQTNIGTVVAVRLAVGR